MYEKHRKERREKERRGETDKMDGQKVRIIKTA